LGAFWGKNFFLFVNLKLAKKIPPPFFSFKKLDFQVVFLIVFVLQRKLKIFLKYQVAFFLFVSLAMQYAGQHFCSGAYHPLRILAAALGESHTPGLRPFLKTFANGFFMKMNQQSLRPGSTFLIPFL